jgi:hypothetical protein
MSYFTPLLKISQTFESDCFSPISCPEDICKASSRDWILAAILNTSDMK